MKLSLCLMRTSDGTTLMNQWGEAKARDNRPQPRLSFPIDPQKLTFSTPCTS